MAKALKDQNTARLMAVIVTNLAVFLMILKTDALSAADFQRLMKDINDLIPAALAIALLTVANGLIGAQTKARLVFWHWTDPLPGCRAFSESAQRDPRVDIDALERKIGKFPIDAREQNAVWYRLYKSVESDPGVTHNHRDFLFTRDYASLAVLFLVFLGALAIHQMDDWRLALPYVAFLAAQYLIVRHVATIYGHRFVTTVLAVKAAEE